MLQPGQFPLIPSWLSLSFSGGILNFSSSMHAILKLTTTNIFLPVILGSVYQDFICKVSTRFGRDQLIKPTQPP
jgi:hypothetical protein